MSIRNVHLIKWTFPAFALLLGFFWYKRRRVSKVDPGGNTKSNKHLNNFEQLEDICKSFNVNSITLPPPSSETLNIDEPSSINKINIINKSPEIVCSPRKVSDSVNIPMKKSSPHQMSMKSGSLSGENSAWIGEDIELVPEMKEVILGSNPKSSSFDLMTKNKTSARLEHIDDEQEEDTHCNKVEITGQEMPIDVNQSLSVSDSNENSCKKPVEEEVVTEENSKTSGQVISERDSANHSPVSGVLEGSVNDEIRSEGSTDSGKGGSINGQLSKNPKPIVYEFELPRHLIARFIGRSGSGIQGVSFKTGVTIILKRHPTSKVNKIASIEGLSENVYKSLDLIRNRFPKKKHPELTLEQVNLNEPITEGVPWLTELMQLQLIEGVNNDVFVCHILEPNHFFIQMPTHPTYPALKVLDHNMTQLYNTVESPPVPDQLSKGMLVVARWYDKWVRAYVEVPDSNGQQHLVRLVDHGGFWTFSNADMRKIRSDYLTLPFQAIEVFLANLKPVNGEWHPEAYDIVATLCSNGNIGQAQIEGYIDSAVYISLYIDIPKHGVISVAHELVARGYAESITFDEMALGQNEPEILENV